MCGENQMRIALMLFLWSAVAWAGEREITDCEICGGTVYQTPKKMVVGNTKYVWIGDPPHKKYCGRCQGDINNGKIDPNDPPLLMSRDDEEREPVHNPYSRDIEVEIDDQVMEKRTRRIEL